MRIVSDYVTYPEKINTQQDRIKFVAVSVNERQPVTGGLGFAVPGPTYTAVDGRVFIAIQAPISDQNSVDWGPDSLNAIDAAVYKASLGAMKESDLGKSIQETLTKIYENAAQNKDKIQKYLAGQAAGVNNILARTDGIILNPNLELLFQGPQLRPFSFTFKMSARSQSEANIIKSIIKYFKYHMAVRTDDSGGLFLKSPNVFTIQYIKGKDEPHPGINVISPEDNEKACALTNFSVDYTPLGSYTTYQDGTMVAYTLNMQFQELTPIYSNDYEELDHPIGY